MCWGVCISRRGIVYFGASIQIFITLIFFVGSSYRAYRISSYVREENRKELLGGIIIATYFFILLMLGLLAFRAIEQKHSSLLGWTVGLTVVLEGLAFGFNLVILSPMGGVHDDYGFRNFGFSLDHFHSAICGIIMLISVFYCYMSIKHAMNLKAEALERQSIASTCRDFDDGGVGSADAPSRASSRDPSTFFNHRSHSHNQLNNEKHPISILEIFEQAKKAKLAEQKAPLAVKAASHPTQPQPQPQLQPEQPSPSSNIQDQNPSSLPQDQPRVPTPHVEVQNQAAQTQPSPPLIPILQHSHQFHHSQTLPHPYHYQRRMQQDRQYLQQEYNQRGPVSAPSFPSVVTASIVPYRFRNPHAGLRTNAAGTLARYDISQYPPALGSPIPPASGRTHTLQRQNSFSCSSMDPMNYDLDQWEQPTVQALKHNYSYNALRRGTHRSDYGVEV